MTGADKVGLGTLGIVTAALIGGALAIGASEGPFVNALSEWSPPLPEIVFAARRAEHTRRIEAIAEDEKRKREEKAAERTIAAARAARERDNRPRGDAEVFRDIGMFGGWHFCTGAGGSCVPLDRFPGLTKQNVETLRARLDYMGKCRTPAHLSTSVDITLEEYGKAENAMFSGGGLAALCQ